MDYDLLVIGSGPGGYAASIHASKLGMKVLVVEGGSIGGVCVNFGCIPSKALINQASILGYTTDLEGMGIRVDSSGFDYSFVHKRMRKAVDSVVRGIEYSFRRHKVEVIEGYAFISGRHEVTVGKRRITSKYILIATGSRPKVLRDFTFDNEFILSSTDVFKLESLPSSVMILGAGAIGVELAYIMSGFGVEVYLAEVMDRILPFEDHEVSNTLLRSLRGRGIKVLTSISISSFTYNGDGVRVNLGSDGLVGVDKLVVVIGRESNIDNIGLEALGIDTSDGFISVGTYYNTVIDSIYAIGDVISTPRLAHLASKEGEEAVNHMFGLDTRGINLLRVPSAIYCEPQVASFGYTEFRARGAGLSFKVAKYYYKGLGKAVAINKSDGFIKLLYDGNRVLGVHIVGIYATEIIHELLLVDILGAGLDSFETIIYAHPTISELVMEVVRIAHGS